MGRIWALVSLASGTLTLGASTLAQGIADPDASTIERLVGGSVLLTVSIVIVRFVFKLLDAARDEAKDARAFLQEEREAWRQERIDLSELINELRRFNRDAGD